MTFQNTPQRKRDSLYGNPVGAHVVSAIQGNNPVFFFQEPVPIMTHVTPATPLGYVYQMMNPALNIPGALMVTLYQSNVGDTSIILSATGSLYGSNTTNNTVEAMFNVRYRHPPTHTSLIFFFFCS